MWGLCPSTHSSFDCLAMPYARQPFSIFNFGLASKIKSANENVPALIFQKPCREPVVHYSESLSLNYLDHQSKFRFFTYLINFGEYGTFHLAPSFGIWSW
jgi:hypothetical protein